MVNTQRASGITGAFASMRTFSLREDPNHRDLPLELRAARDWGSFQPGLHSGSCSPVRHRHTASSFPGNMWRRGGGGEYTACTTPVVPSEPQSMTHFAGAPPPSGEVPSSAPSCLQSGTPAFKPCSPVRYLWHFGQAASALLASVFSSVN